MDRRKFLGILAGVPFAGALFRERPLKHKISDFKTATQAAREVERKSYAMDVYESSHYDQMIMDDLVSKPGVIYTAHPSHDPKFIDVTEFWVRDLETIVGRVP